jgi:predicted O-methyltransferase YrrM/rhodanese-related sulfurtransferase
MPALEWHQKLKEAKEKQDRGEADPGITLLDCRNTYETDVGRFEGAEPLNTENFRESWDALKERLKDTPRDAPIMTYCTGGIRCVKVGAYLTQELGFQNVARLKGGIIAYDRTLNEQVPGEEPMFKGTNFVFDGRLGRPITEDALAMCTTCGAETSLVSNCRNDNCHKRMVQCENCRTSFQGTCSDACRNRLVNGSMRPRRNENKINSEAPANISDGAAAPSTQVFTSLDEYSSGHSSPPPSVYAEMEHNTRALIPSGSHMVSGSAQGRFLKHLASMTREGRILEVGTFTGYATACLLEGAANAGQSIGVTNAGTRTSGPFVMTMERDVKAYEVAVAQLRIFAEHGTGEAGAEAMCALRSDALGTTVIDSVSNGDSVTVQYNDTVASCELMHVTDALACVEEMAAGRGSKDCAPFDMVFLDADKTRLIEYCEALLSSSRVLKKGGLIVVDNVLWKGLVLEASSGNFSSLEDCANSEESELRKNRRARKLANNMHRFNSEIVKDDRVEVLVLPFRDGLSVIRKK